ncbi:MAG: hypothetical protein M3Y07_05420 [Acidobacteriota bacterium]|nr:hypothetical protein [Acidobacteriota bacterium]
MKTLRESLVLTGARAISLLRQVTKDGNTFVLLVKGPLSPGLADTLRCRNQIYNLNDNPYPALKSLALDHEISSCEMSVAGHGLLQPTVVAGFTIKPSEAADADGALELSFRLKFSTGKKELNAMLDSVKDNPFDLALVALQANLFDAEPSKGDGPDGGTAVDLSGEGKTAEPTAEELGEQPEETAPRSRRKASSAN